MDLRGAHPPVLAKKAGFAVMTALHDVQGDSVKVSAWAARHDGKITKKARLEIIRAWRL